MKRLVVVFGLVFFLCCILFVRVKAQSGNVIYLGAVVGTTKAANCGTPTTPSICIVGDGVWVWQNSVTGWFLIQAPIGSGVTSWNGQTGAVQYNAPAAPVTSVNGKTGAVVLSIQ